MTITEQQMAEAVEAMKAAYMAHPKHDGAMEAALTAALPIIERAGLERAGRLIKDKAAEYATHYAASIRDDLPGAASMWMACYSTCMVLSADLRALAEEARG